MLSCNSELLYISCVAFHAVRTGDMHTFTHSMHNSNYVTAFAASKPHGFLVLFLQEISKLRYELCPRYMKERKFWRIYFILVNSHVAP